LELFLGEAIKPPEMKYMLLFALFFSFKLLSAQDISSPDTIAVVVHKDPRVDILAKKQTAVNHAIKRASARTARGYRLLVLNTNKRDEAIQAKTTLYKNYPEIASYLNYQTPYFKLKAGNFRSREEADKYRKIFQPLFPKGVYIVNDIIEVTPEKERADEK
jgi:hypothetical protein